MLFYHVQIKDMIHGVNIRGKASAASINRTGGALGNGGAETLIRDFGG